MKRPTEILKEDHKVILRMIEVIRGLSQKIDIGEKVDIEHLNKIVEFIKIFADKCHHAKEENLLFPAMEEAGIPKEGGPIGVMLIEHDQGREYVKGMVQGIEELKTGNNDGLKKFKQNSLGYAGLLEPHIDKENNILYMMADMHIEEETQQKLLADFERVEKEVIGNGKHEEFHHLVETLEKIYLN